MGKDDAILPLIENQKTPQNYKQTKNPKQTNIFSSDFNLSLKGSSQPDESNCLVCMQFFCF